MSSQLAASGVAEVIMLSSHDMNLRKPTAIGDPNWSWRVGLFQKTAGNNPTLPELYHVIWKSAQ